MDFPRTSPEAAAARLVNVVQELSAARDINSIADIVRRAARELTGADGATFVLRDGDQCHYVDEDAIEPLWKGLRFPMSACISGWAMLNAKAVAIEDIYADPRIPADAYRPTFVKSLAMVPIRRNAPFGAIGNYWATQRMPTPFEIETLQALADTTSVAMENTRLFLDLQDKIKTLSAREARIAAQRDALHVYARSLAHDLKEPVRTIRSFAEIIMEAGPSALPRNMTFIRDAGERMGMLIDSVFNYTQLDRDELEKEHFALEEAVEAAKANLAALIRERRAVVICEGLPAAAANRTQMIQMLQNLIANAISHSEGEVRVHVSARRADGFLAVCVRDDGPGIAESYHAKIFEPFGRLNRDDAHAGLGLAICKRIAELHGGAITCRSEPGRGAAFIFTLPDAGGAETAQTVVALKPGPAARIAAQGLATVLIVDDREPDIRLAQAFLGEPLGMRCRFLIARDGAEGLAAIAEAAKTGATIDLVLLDINMPILNGFEMLERMRADPVMREMPVVVCSGSTCEEDLARAAALDALGYLPKPPRFEQLREILEQSTAFRFSAEEGVSPALMRVA